MKSFFEPSIVFDHQVVRPLSHILPNWELTWDDTTGKYVEEEDSYAKLLNVLISELDSTIPPSKYHDNEDRLAEYVKKSLNWKIYKKGNRWLGMDYFSILEQGGFQDIDQNELLLAAAGRIKAAKDSGQFNFDDMEKSHREMLAAVITIILYHRTEFVWHFTSRHCAGDAVPPRIVQLGERGGKFTASGFHRQFVAADFADLHRRHAHELGAFDDFHGVERSATDDV